MVKVFGVTLIVVAVLPAAAAAQTNEALVSKVQLTVRMDGRMGMPGDPSSEGPGISTPRKDSLWNGIIIGAGLGALTGAVGSRAISDCSECSGFNVPLTFGVLGAGIGAGLGAGLDALHTQSATHFSRGRVRLSPVLGKGRRGVMAWIRF
jgi:hypothetical protein